MHSTLFCLLWRSDCVTDSNLLFFFSVPGSFVRPHGLCYFRTGNTTGWPSQPETAGNFESADARNRWRYWRMLKYSFHWNNIPCFYFAWCDLLVYIYFCHICYCLNLSQRCHRSFVVLLFARAFKVNTANFILSCSVNSPQNPGHPESRGWDFCSGLFVQDSP